MNIELLKRLRTRFLRMRHPKHFRMAQIAIKTDCGAAMCMIGHILDLEGYKMRSKRKYNPEKDDNLWSVADAARSDYEFIHPKTGKVVDEPLFEASDLVGLDYDAAGELLFHHFELKTPTDAAKYLEKLIEDHQVVEAEQ